MLLKDYSNNMLTVLVIRSVLLFRLAVVLVIRTGAPQVLYVHDVPRGVFFREVLNRNFRVLKRFDSEVFFNSSDYTLKVKVVDVTALHICVALTKPYSFRVAL